MRFKHRRREKSYRRIFHHRWRHPFDRGSALARWGADQFRILLDHRFWARHPAPFNKTEAGRRRRAEKRFMREARLAFLNDLMRRDDEATT